MAELSTPSSPPPLEQPLGPGVPARADVGRLHYQRQDGLALPARTPVLPMVALAAALLHATFAALLAVVLGFGGSWSPQGHVPVAVLMVGQTPTLAVALVLAAAGHHPAGGRRLAGPAMWVAAVTPAGSAAVLFLVTAVVEQGDLHGRFMLAVLVVVAVNSLVVLGLRNRVLKEKAGPLPVLPYLDGDVPADPPIGPRPRP